MGAIPGTNANSRGKLDTYDELDKMIDQWIIKKYYKPWDNHLKNIIKSKEELL